VGTLSRTPTGKVADGLLIPFVRECEHPLRATSDHARPERDHQNPAEHQNDAADEQAPAISADIQSSHHLQPESADQPAESPLHVICLLARVLYDLWISAPVHQQLVSNKLVPGRRHRVTERGRAKNVEEQPSHCEVADRVEVEHLLWHRDDPATVSGTGLAAVFN
jgi:hypothetical protein